MWFLFFFLTSGVSTLQGGEYCRGHLMGGLTGSGEHGGRLLTGCRLISTNKEVDY